MTSRRRRGSALLTVLWLSAALSAIVFTVANSVRGETERTATAMDGLRCSYLAGASIDRALLRIQWGGKYFTSPMPVMRFDYPGGDAMVEIIPESSKFAVNQATPADLGQLLAGLGVPPDRAAGIAAAIVDWRSPAAGGTFTGFDEFYLAQKPSFRSPHSSVEEIEELLLVRGMTPELFHGRYERDGQGALRPVGGLKDCVSTYGVVTGFDVNTAAPALLRGLGLSPGTVAGIVARRQSVPIKSMGEIAALNDGSPGFGRLSLTPSPVCTIRATARLRLANGQFSDIRRSVSALVRFLTLDNNPPYHVLRWYDSPALAQ